jgi:hypothetical protein
MHSSSTFGNSVLIQKSVVLIAFANEMSQKTRGTDAFKIFFSLPPKTNMLRQPGLEGIYSPHVTH